MTSYVLALDVRRSPFRHILWAKVQPGFKGVNIGGCGSLGAEGIFFGDKLSINRARGDHLICRANKIDYKTITASY